MRKLALAIFLLIPLTACSTITKLEDAAKVLSGATVSPQAVVIAANSVNALEATATNYLRLRRCNGTNGPVCRDPVATAKLIPAVRAARRARDNLIGFLKAHPGQLGPSGLYDALQRSISTVADIISRYRIGAAA